MTDYPTLLRLLGRQDRDVHSAFRTGSRTYGTAHEGSDEDFLVVLHAEVRPDLLFRPNVNVVIQSQAQYQRALHQQSVFALEAWFSKGPLKRGDATWTPDTQRLALSATEKSASDINKAATLFERDRRGAKKRLFHALRVPMFARQIARTGSLHDYTEAMPLWDELLAHHGVWDDLRPYLDLRDRLCSQIR